MKSFSMSLGLSVNISSVLNFARGGSCRRTFKSLSCLMGTWAGGGVGWVGVSLVICWTSDKIRPCCSTRLKSEKKY